MIFLDLLTNRFPFGFNAVFVLCILDYRSNYFNKKKIELRSAMQTL